MSTLSSDLTEDPESIRMDVAIKAVLQQVGGLACRKMSMFSQEALGFFFQQDGIDSPGTQFAYQLLRSFFKLVALCRLPGVEGLRGIVGDLCGHVGHAVGNSGRV